MSIHRMPTPMRSFDDFTRIDPPDRLPIGLLERIGATIRLWTERQRTRRALGNLAELDDYLLRDIGVSRAQALRESAKPFWLC